MRHISSAGLLAGPDRRGAARLQILSIVGAAVIVAVTAFFTSAQAQYRGAAIYRGPYGGVAVVRGGYRHAHYGGSYGGYRGGAIYRGYRGYGGYYGGTYGYGYRHWSGGYRPAYGYGPRYYGGYGHPRSYAGYFAPGYLGPEFGPGYYEVTVFPTTYYDLPPYEEPGWAW